MFLVVCKIGNTDLMNVLVDKVLFVIYEVSYEKIFHLLLIDHNEEIILLVINGLVLLGK